MVHSDALWTRFLEFLTTAARLEWDDGTDSGQDMVEYALLMGAISVVCLGIVILVGPFLDNTFLHIINGLQSA